MGYKYQLEKYKGRKTRFTCPSCRAKFSFTRYINIENNEYLDDEIGICNREIKCGYHKSPKEYFMENNLPFENVKQSHKPIIKTVPDFISPEIISESLVEFGNNNFVQFLYSRFHKDEVDKVMEMYKVGTHKHWKGATVFWQIDTAYKVRTGKVMLFDADIGKRIKKPYPHVNWIHSLLLKQGEISEFNLSQCFFGEHLLKLNKLSNIAIVESEKTALICAIEFPEMLWLASGGLSNLNSEKVNILKNRQVTLFPDNGAYEKWKSKADNFGFKTSSLLEEKGSKGQDFADYILNYKQ